MKNIYTPHVIKLQSNALVHGRAVLSVSALLRRDKPHRPEIIWAAVFADGHQRKFEDVVKSAQDAAVLMLVY
ncbi:MAG TPA: hypothetical protein DCQ92_10890 [Verrucomicrobia subdivision 3 bacterium]|nr:hypothetical protein [Limisphaerales bacterium]